MGDPAKVVHYRAEGTSEFTALLYLLERPVWNSVQDYKIGPTLYVKRVQIMDLRTAHTRLFCAFVKGWWTLGPSVECFPEILQINKQIEVIKKNITKKYSTLDDMKKNITPRM